MSRTHSSREARRETHQEARHHDHPSAGAGPGVLRVGVLVDLRWSPNAGGHVKTWERLAAAALDLPESLDLTVHFAGADESTRVIGPNVRYRLHRPIFSSARLPFLSHVPDHADLGRHHRRLARQLGEYDVIHTTDGAFAFARTAARIAGRLEIPLVSSVHTDTPRYTRIFTAATVERLAGRGRLARLLLDRWGLARRAEARMRRRIDAHQRRCAFVLCARVDDRSRVSGLLGPERVGLLRRGVDHRLFDPARRDRPWLAAQLGVPPEGCLVISVGRLDRGKNVMTLARAVRQLADSGVAIHLLCAGEGADRGAVRELLGDRISCPGVLDPAALARAYASSDLCAQPSEVEEHSNAVLEALASGLPALVAAPSGSGRLVVEGQTGVVIGRSSDAGAWADALRGLAADPQRRAGMGRMARAWARQNIPSWRQVLLEDLLPIWRAAAAAGRPRITR
jgi:glycosyltransferase involved in cell wall biosynthesis